jgi:flagellar motor switch protein FliM
MDKTLSQEEVDALLGAIKSGDVTTEQAATFDTTEKVKVASYNFRKPRLISNEQLRGFQMIHDTFVRGLQSSLLMNLRTTLEIKLVAVDMITYGEFVLSLSNPTYMAVLYMSAGIGEICIEMNLSIVMAIIDILLGGDGNNVEEPRSLTAIELSVSGGLMGAMLAELKAAWASVIETNFQVQSYESNPEFVQLTTPESLVVSVTLDLHMGGASGIMNLCYPYSVIQPILSKLSARVQARTGRGRRGEQDQHNMREALADVPLDVKAVLGNSVVTTEELMKLRPGDVICLDQRATQPLKVYVGERMNYLGELGRSQGKVATKILQRKGPVSLEEE